jgi:Protein of unknown function (DUF3592)
MAFHRSLPANGCEGYARESTPQLPPAYGQAPRHCTGTWAYDCVRLPLIVGCFATTLRVCVSLCSTSATVFADLYDAISMLWSWRWPKIPGEITAVGVKKMQDSEGIETFRLAVAYKFSIGNDGPYTGESFWQPTVSSKKRVFAARDKVWVNQKLIVRYRPDDPSVTSSIGASGKISRTSGSSAAIRRSSAHDGWRCTDIPVKIKQASRR